MTFNLPTDPNMWVIAGLLFVLGVLIGMLLTAGGRRKWKERYEDEVQTRESWQAEHARVQQELDERERERRERAPVRPTPAPTTAGEPERERERERVHVEPPA
jgi:hypothetical protein